ncbi:hypothetical protein G7074_18005 [Pedobacter sp. HDW13]|uniref:hypothetical protein n=1 Tax=Pedobacter sp. HDW13 TaxID=2714940 RepID=UPI001408BE07|nr:hypothetical protein [Pedobacter sp. HDW13]QIL40993.1 hypothetical protein G7074_18005 [Pedobacter sp. HDW13]
MKQKQKRVYMKITLIDFDKVGFDCNYKYVTPDMSDDDDPLIFLVDSSDFLQFVNENNLNELQTDVDEFRKTDDWDYLIDYWIEIKDRYWNEIVKPDLDKIFSDMDKLKVNVTHDLEISVKEVAGLFSSMSPLEQAEFFNEIGANVKDWNQPFSFSLQALQWVMNNNPCLTQSGKQMMLEIGLLAKESEVKDV